MPSPFHRLPNEVHDHGAKGFGPLALALLQESEPYHVVDGRYA